MATKLAKNYKKRKFLTKENCIKKIFDNLHGVFTAYSNAVDKFNMEIRQTIPEARIRLSAALLNAKMTESFIRTFPSSWRIGKYNRVIFRFDGVQLIIKKLDKTDKPSSIPTRFWTSISNQEQLSLFKDNTEIEEPILIFGYTKDQMGQIDNPRIIFYDGEKKWSITREDVKLKPVAKKISTNVDVSVKKEKRKRKID